MQLGRLWRTVRHLRREQIVGRLVLKFTRPTVDPRPAPPRRGTLGPWIAGPARPATMSAADRFRFLNVEQRLPFPTGWAEPGVSRLWLYNLHYFDDLVAAAAAERAGWHRELIARWVADNPPGQGVGWEPFPLSVRIANWIKWAWSGHELPPGALDSLAVQLRWLEHRLEYHLLGNHLLTNAWALTLGGLYFEGPEAKRWRTKGLGIYDQQLPEQILADGGHYERSPMYHAAVLDQLLDVHQALGATGDELAEYEAPWRQRLAEIIGRMRSWLAAMTHPDGEIAFFNDAAIGVAPAPGEIEGYAGRLGFPPSSALPQGCVDLPQSGYVRLTQGPAVAILDVGPIGPDFLPGHAHADTLSFELSLFGRRFAVNSGTSTYDEGPLREWQRSTAAHNTLELGGESSSEMWGSFRVGRRARAECILPPGSREDAHEDFSRNSPLLLSGAHDGYGQRVPGVRHLRVWRFTETALAFSDALCERTGQPAATSLAVRCRLYLHPEVEVENPERPATEPVVCRLGEHRVRVWLGGGDPEVPRPLRLIPACYYPRFGVEVENRCLEWDELEAHLRIDWST